MLSGTGCDRPSAWSRIYQNVFDFNRHSVAANGYMGGYQAERNLVLKGGGFHGSAVNRDTHVFDIHGTDGCNLGGANCGAAGRTSLFRDNTFQYKKTRTSRFEAIPRILQPSITMSLSGQTGAQRSSLPRIAAGLRCWKTISTT